MFRYAFWFMIAVVALQLVATAVWANPAAAPP